MRIPLGADPITACMDTRDDYNEINMSLRLKQNLRRATREQYCTDDDPSDQPAPVAEP